MFLRTRLAAGRARSLPVMFACPLILCSNVERPSLILYWSEMFLAAINVCGRGGRLCGRVVEALSG
jgi:hypothetical protein